MTLPALRLWFAIVMMSGIFWPLAQAATNQTVGSHLVVG